MKTIQHLFSNELIEALGWTLVHSFWQGAVVALGLSVLMLLMRRNSAQLKYFISFVSLIILLGWSVVTFTQSYRYASEKAVLKENITSSPGYIKSLLKQNLTEDVVIEIKENASLNLQMVKIRSFFQRNFNILCSLWIIGMLFLSLRLVGSFLYLKRIRTTNLIDIGEEWIARLGEMTDKLHIKRKVRAFFSPFVNVPLTIGWFKPVLLFPISAFTGLSTKEIEAILAHELAHVLRHDYLFNIIQSIVEILFFYHPGVWVISSQIRNERENSCDNIAIELTGDKVAFAKALAAVQIYQMEQERLAMTFASSRGNILQRIKRLQKKVAMKTNFIEGLIAAGVIVIGLTLASFTIGHDVPEEMKPASVNLATNSQQQSVPTTVEKEYTTVEVDSILNVTQEKVRKNKELGQKTDELKEVIEVALSEQDHQVSAEMLNEINKALEDINIDKIVSDAMKEASVAMKEAKEEIDREGIDRDMKDARHDIEKAKKEVEEDFRRDMKNATNDVEREGLRVGLEAATAGLNVAAAVLENLPIEEIIGAALSGVEVALKSIGEIDFDSAYKKGEISQSELEQLKEQMKQKDIQLKEQQKQLEKQMKELDKKMDNLEKTKK